MTCRSLLLEEKAKFTNLQWSITTTNLIFLWRQSGEQLMQISHLSFIITNTLAGLTSVFVFRYLYCDYSMPKKFPDYMNQYRDFDNDPIRFNYADGKVFLDKLHAEGKHYIPIVDSAIYVPNPNNASDA